MLPFHSAGFCVRREFVVEVGGYPELEAAEDVGLVLAVTDASAGRVIPDLTTLYRKWSGQTTSASSIYAASRSECLHQIEHLVRIRRGDLD
jgi:hypothetical protein